MYTQLIQNIWLDIYDPFREQIDLGRELPAEPIEGRPAYVHMHGPNQWPEALPEFKTIILELMYRMSQVGLTLLRAMAQSLKMIDEKAFMEMFGDDYGVRMKVARYPPMSSSLNDPALSHGLGVGPHKVKRYDLHKERSLSHYINRAGLRLFGHSIAR